jgi:hypothetical protein
LTVEIRMRPESGEVQVLPLLLVELLLALDAVLLALDALDAVLLVLDEVLLVLDEVLLALDEVLLVLDEVLLVLDEVLLALDEVLEVELVPDELLAAAELEAPLEELPLELLDIGLPPAPPSPLVVPPPVEAPGPMLFSPEQPATRMTHAGKNNRRRLERARRGGTLMETKGVEGSRRGSEMSPRIAPGPLVG